jgi:hypothetical protein
MNGAERGLQRLNDIQAVVGGPIVDDYYFVWRRILVHERAHCSWQQVAMIKIGHDDRDAHSVIMGIVA